MLNRTRRFWAAVALTTVNLATVCVPAFAQQTRPLVRPTFRDDAPEDRRDREPADEERAVRRTQPQAQPQSQTRPQGDREIRGPIREANSQPGNSQRPPAKPRAPFELTQKEQQALDKLLKAWEAKSSAIKTFKCEFEVWDYDPAFGPSTTNSLNGLRARGKGEIKYQAPDNGVYHEAQMWEYEMPQDPDARPVAKMEEKELQKLYKPVKSPLAHWVCDGKSIFQYEPDKKVLREMKIAPELQGKEIVNGPLPFIFGAKADRLKQRYWLRLVTPSDVVGKEVWLEALPKYQQDAADYTRVVISLTEGECQPTGIQIFQPAAAARGVLPHKSYVFNKVKINDFVSKITGGDFAAPMTPWGWTRVVEQAPTEPPPSERPAGRTDQSQAKRPAVSKARN